VLDWFSANQFFIDNTLITALLVMSFFVALQAGVFSLASVGFMAVGGYMTGVLTTQYNLGIPLGVFAGTLAGAVLALLFGLAVLRLSGIYLALGTFALGQATIIVIGELNITHAQQGIIGIPPMFGTWWALAGLAVTGLVFEVIRRSHHGRAFRAVRVDDVVARSMGINASRYRLVALVLSGLLAGFAGALNAHEVGVISPDQYSFGLLVLGLTYAMVGGVEHWSGAMLAAIALGIFREQVRGIGTDAEDAAYGVLLVALMFLAPRGLGDRRLARLLRVIAARLHLSRGPVPALAGAVHQGGPTHEPDIAASAASVGEGDR
jgi:branched-chain amino acid transport system permease protein